MSHLYQRLVHGSSRMFMSCCILLVLLVAGCYSPSGGAMPHTGRGFVYISTPLQPLTVTIVDTRTEEPFFLMEIPPGKQLTFDFIEDKGDDPVYRPARMRYEVFTAGTQTGRLRNQMTVPGADSRRIDVTVRKDVEYADLPPGHRMRTDQMIDRPEYWTPEGGPLPGSSKAPLYDN